MIKALMTGVGDVAFGSQLLQAMNYVAAFDHCTLYEFRGEQAPDLLGVSSWGSPQRVRQSTSAYLDRFHHFDPARSVMEGSGDRLFLRYHSGCEMQNSEFRRTCYESVAILDRLSIVTRTDGGSWFVANLFRDAARGPLEERQLDIIGQHAFLVGMAGRQEIHLRTAVPRDPTDIGDACPERAEELARSWQKLSDREREVCQLIALGHMQMDIACRLGLRESTVITFRKRAYQKLGVANARELRRLAGEIAGR